MRPVKLARPSGPSNGSNGRAQVLPAVATTTTSAAASAAASATTTATAASAAAAAEAAATAAEATAAAAAAEAATTAAAAAAAAAAAFTRTAIASLVDVQAAAVELRAVHLGDRLVSVTGVGERDEAEAAAAARLAVTQDGCVRDLAKLLECCAESVGIRAPAETTYEELLGHDFSASLIARHGRA